jgi:hypothetical protein
LRGVDPGLHILRGAVDIAIKSELKGDARRPVWLCDVISVVSDLPQMSL